VPTPEPSVPAPPYDPELEVVLDAVRETLSDGLDITQIQEIRAMSAAVQPAIESVLDGHDVVHSEISVPGPPGAPDVVLSVLRPTDQAGGAPGIFHIHGGGMITLDRFFGAAGLVELVETFDAVVTSVEYRLAPEHPDPAPVEDCYAGLCWVAEHAAEIGVDPASILVHGESAGGGLAAGVALLARDRGGPELLGQVLMCPMLDDRNDSVSSHQYTDRSFWNRRSNDVGWTALLGDRRGGPDVSPYAAPARAGDLAGLPPAFLDVGSAEVFRDEVVAYASRLWAAGGQAELAVWSGGFHGFELFATDAEVSRAAKAARHSWIRRLLAQASRPPGSVAPTP